MPLINKTDLLDNIKRTIDTLQTHGDANYIRGLRDAMRIVEAAPAIEQERKKGKWVKIKEMIWECPVCKRKNCYAYHYNDDLTMQVLQDFFCPNCGAEMGGEEDG